MALSPPASTLDSLRGIFIRDDKDKISANLKSALSLLQLYNIDALEERFLATDAFLRPWAVFRDSILLLQPDAMLKPTRVGADAVNNISRLDILWFYTQFDENLRRYDSHADTSSQQYSPISIDHGVIDKREWGIRDYEKHLFAWLLQTLMVGKTRNLWGFDYFELRSLCTVWEAVLVPIVNAVRASYSVKGRRYYGRLALYIEDRCPSRLAFPEDNVGTPATDISSPTPFRLVSMPKQGMGSDGATFRKNTRKPGTLTKKHYDETEKELRIVYPQYGGLVERPKFKHKMEEWLAEQRARADLRKANATVGEVKYHQPQTVQPKEHQSPTKKDTSPIKSRRQASNDGSPSPIKRYSDSIRRSLTRSISRNLTKEEPKSPLHGVTRQIHIPDVTLDHREPAVRQAFAPLGPPIDLVTPWPRPEPYHKVSSQDTHLLFRSSNSTTGDVPEDQHLRQALANKADLVASDSKLPAAILRPAAADTGHLGTLETLRDEVLAIRAKKSRGDVRMPSYEGTDYKGEISLTKLHAVTRNESPASEPIRLTKPRSRLPGPIQPVAYAGHLRTASKDENNNGVSNESPAVARLITTNPTLKPVSWPASSLPKPVAWPGSESHVETKPPLPAKSPERWNSARGHVTGSQTQSLVHDHAQSMLRIVSKENIRAALGGASRDSSDDELAPNMPMPPTESPDCMMNLGGSTLTTYNTHLFPRKEDRETSLGKQITDHGPQHQSGETYEMEELSNNDPDCKHE